MSALRPGSTCPGCGPQWILTLRDFAYGACGHCGYVLGRDVPAEREWAELLAVSSLPDTQTEETT